MAADSPGVLTMVERLRSNRPAGSEPDEAGAAFIYREGMASAMEQEEAARRLTLALAGRAPQRRPRAGGAHAAGAGADAAGCGRRNGPLQHRFSPEESWIGAIVWDRPEVLKVTAEFAATHGVADRLECRPGDMFADAVPPADVVLLSNVLHDWDMLECRNLVSQCAAALPRGGRLLIHEVFLNNALDGPLPIALYSAALFCVTEGRAYSAAEYRGWLKEAGLARGGDGDADSLRRAGGGEGGVIPCPSSL